jgi:hypothetical protein
LVFDEVGWITKTVILTSLLFYFVDIIIHLSITYPNFPGNNVTYTYGAAAQRRAHPWSATWSAASPTSPTAPARGPALRRTRREIASETRSIPIQGGQVITYIL